MSTVIKGGTIVAADRTYKADILIEGETIAAIGQDLKGDTVVDAEGAYIMPGGIDPHTHLEMPFMGTTAAETWESGTFAALSGGTTLVVDFVIPGPDGMLAALDDWEGKADAPGLVRLFAAHVRQRLVGEAFRRDAEGDRARHQHLQAFHGLQGRADGQ